MARTRRSAVQRYHDRVAGVYDHSYDDAFWQWHDALTWDYLKPHLPRDVSREVVDLGCGTGKWGLKLLQSGFRVTFVDISPQMVDQARRKVEETIGGARASFVQADLADLSSISAERFALAIAFGEPIGCTDSPAQALSQIRRILADDGILAATFDNRWAAIDFYLERGDPAELARFLRDGRTHWLTKETRERFPIVTYAPDELHALLEQAGLEILEMIGKTVLPMRQFRQLLTTAEDRRAWSRIEKTLARNPSALARAAHLQVACKRGGTVKRGSAGVA